MAMMIPGVRWLVNEVTGKLAGYRNPFRDQDEPLDFGGAVVIPGGDTGYALRKNSAVDGDYSFLPLPTATIPSSTFADRGTGAQGDPKVVTDYFRGNPALLTYSTAWGDYVPNGGLQVFWRVPFDGADKSAALRALINQMQVVNNNRGGTIFFPIGDILLNNFALGPADSNITFVGACVPLSETPRGGTHFVSQSGFGVLRITGTATSPVGSRVNNVNFINIGIRGAGDTQDLVILERTSRVRFYRCHWNNTTGRALYLREAWDGWADDCDFTFCGSSSRPVVEANSPGAGYDYLNQYWIRRARFENNQGVDVAVTGTNTNEFYVQDAKMETSTSSAPRVTVNNSAVNVELKGLQIAFGGNTNQTDLIRLQNARMVRGDATFERAPPSSTGVPVNYMTVQNCAQIVFRGQVAPSQPAPSSGVLVNYDGNNIPTIDIQFQHEWTNVTTFSAARGPSRYERFLGYFPALASFPTNASVPVGATAAAVDNGAEYRWNGSAWRMLGVTMIPIAIGDEDTEVVSGVGTFSFVMPFDYALAEVQSSVKGVSTSGLVTVDINEAGASILSTKLSIDANETSSQTAATPAVLSDTLLAKGSLVSIDIDNAGTSASGLKIYLVGRPV